MDRARAQRAADVLRGISEARRLISDCDVEMSKGGEGATTIVAPRRLLGEIRQAALRDLEGFEDELAIL